ncbi:hypothetical protein [Enterococcus sp. AZ126]|uniref:hypothetical protein n=1 Tax=Enterococcus sp. AZ126 TaxID=2774635 RepID=UPI003F299053
MIFTKKQKILKLIELTTDNIIVYEEKYFLNELTLSAVSIHDTLKEHIVFPLRVKSKIFSLLETNNCQIIEFDEWVKIKVEKQFSGFSK